MSRQPLAIGIACYPTFGGSGVIATEVGMEMARRGHRVHVMSYDVPRRLDQFLENIYFHEVEIASYPLFDHQPYALALASKMYEVSDQQKLDVLHVHYAIPHAVSAYLAVQMLEHKKPKVITTLHGTDITLVGNDRTYLPITRLSIQKSDGVTAVSKYLKQATYDKLNINASFPIEVIPNFVDLEVFTPIEKRRDLVMRQLCGKRERPIITHISNFRPVKRIQDVIQIFAEVRKKIDCVLVMAGDGPERSNAEQLCRDLKICSDVCFLGKQTAVNEVLWCSDLFLMPSQSESFGLGALEAMACAVPVVASNVGGLPEVVKDGVSGYLCDLGDIATMATKVVELLQDPVRRKKMGAAGREIASNNFEMKQIVSQYEDYYYRMVNG